MMAGMMLPSATPMVFAFLRISRARPEPPSHVALAGAFMLGYLLPYDPLLWGAGMMAPP